MAGRDVEGGLVHRLLIQNKIFGDGLGFTRRELLMMENLSADGGNLDDRGSGMTKQQEAMMVTGGYHSGPVQTVRAVGYVGLVILLLAMIRLAVHAHRQIIRCRETEWFPLALYAVRPRKCLDYATPNDIFTAPPPIALAT